MESTTAILLRKRKLSDTSLIISWCTNSLGCIQTVAKGARRAKSPFAGKLDLFFQAEIQIARSRKSNLHTLREVALTNPFGGIRQSYPRMQAASYFVELVEICTESDHHDPELFALLQRAFGYLSANEPTLRAVTHFETELARIAGVHDVNAIKRDPAFALASLFGKLPLSRAPLLKVLRAGAPSGRASAAPNHREHVEADHEKEERVVAGEHAEVLEHPTGHDAEQV
ncbi:MAG TPA: DNA repair protein RecO [Chthoniobacterales bacterium]